MSAAESRLAGLAYALLGDRTVLTEAEKALVSRSDRPTKKDVAAAKRAIKGGRDVLGQAFTEARSREVRRKLGATYTPRVIVDSMMAWASAQSVVPVRVVDPGCGTGTFLGAAACLYPEAVLVGVDTDPLAVLMLRANATVLGFSCRLQVYLEDYREADLGEAEGPTLFVGNPPYIRHHDIGPRWKEWFSATARKMGFRASTLAGMHVHFFLRTHEIAKAGDIGLYITAGEWLDVNYGAVMRQMLAAGLGCSSIHVIDPKAKPFEDALSTGTITCFHVGNRPARLVVRAVDGLSDLGHLTGGTAIPWEEAVVAPKWSIFTRARIERQSDMMEVGELFRVHRGQVTGGNAVWIAGDSAKAIPTNRLLPAITKARELFAAGRTLKKADHLRRVIDLPADLSELDFAERVAVERFLKWAKSVGADKSYIASHRKAWWSVTYKEPAAILCTYMARRAPHFVVNAAGARHLNIAHGLYPRQPMSKASLDRVADSLRLHATMEGGRTYAGGLVKFEPKELERMLMPRLELIDGTNKAASKDMDNRRTDQRRGCGRRSLQA